MSLGSSLYHARKKSGFSQENVAEKLGVSRQTIYKNGRPMRCCQTFVSPRG